MLHDQSTDDDVSKCAVLFDTVPEFVHSSTEGYISLVLLSVFISGKGAYPLTHDNALRFQLYDSLQKAKQKRTDQQRAWETGSRHRDRTS